MTKTETACAEKEEADAAALLACKRQLVEEIEEITLAWARNPRIPATLAHPNVK